jgi:DNA-binding CsgD family transcriptional regulator
MEQVAPIGRGDLLARLTELLSAQSARVELVGEPGIGKTTVLRSAASGYASTCRVIAVTASETERLVGLATASDLVQALGDVEARLPERVRKHLRSLTNPLDDGASALDQRIVGVALAALIREAALDRPLLLVVDDFQWVDDASYVLLAYALRRTLESDVRAMVAKRPSEDRLLKDATSVEVGAVDVGALRGLVASQLSRVLPIDVAAALHTAVGGNPMYAMETVRALPPHATALDVRLPQRLADLVVSRVNKLPDGCRSVLLDVAVRGRESLHSLSEPDRLDPAFDARIVQHRGSVVEFVHPLLRQAAIDAAGPGELRRAHLAAAEAASDAPTRALHVAAMDLRDDEAVASELESASDAAYRVGDGPGARFLAQAAVTATPVGGLTWSRQAMLVRAVGIAGPVPDDLLERLLSLARTPDQKASTWLAAVEGRQAPIEAWRAYAERAMDIDGTSPGIAIRSADELATSMLFAGRPYDEILAVLDAAIARTKRHLEDAHLELDELSDTDAFGLASALTSRSLFARIAGRPSPADDLHLARRLERDHAFAPDDDDATSALGLIALWDDRHAEAREYLDPDRRKEERCGDFGAFHLAELESRLGNFNAVRELVDPLAAPTPQSSDFFVLALAAAWQGDETLCREELRVGRAYSDEVGDSMYPPAFDTAEALLALGMGNFAEARDRAVATADALEGRGWNEPSIFPVLPIAIEAAAITGRRDDAERLLQRLEGQAEMLDSRWARAAAQRGRGLLLGADGDARGGLALAVSSTTAFDELGLPTEVGRSALAAGRLARRAGERTAAREWLERAIELLESRGCRGFAAQAREELSRIGGRHVADGDLTDAERRVAELAAEGRTNPEIAAAAFLSVKTVEAHLSRVYRKLGVRSRAELAARWNG